MWVYCTKLLGQDSIHCHHEYSVIIEGHTLICQKTVHTRKAKIASKTIWERPTQLVKRSMHKVINSSPSRLSIWGFKILFRVKRHQFGPRYQQCNYICWKRQLHGEISGLQSQTKLSLHLTSCPQSFQFVLTEFSKCSFLSIITFLICLS